MKKCHFNLNNLIFSLLLIIIFSATIFTVPTKFQNSNLAIAENTNESSLTENPKPAYSIFINDPAFSFVHGNNLYFYDNFDKNLKIFSLTENKFDSNYLNLSEFGNIIDACICENYIFAIFSLNNILSIQKITLDENSLSINKIQNIDFENKDYSKIHVIYFEDNFYITLTPKINSESMLNNISALIFQLASGSNSIFHTTTINLSELNLSSLMKIILTTSSTNSFNLIFACATEIYASNLEIDLFSNNQINIYDTHFRRSLDSSNIDQEIYASVSVSNVNLCKINENNFIIVTYNYTTVDGTIASYTNFHLFNLSFSAASTFTIKHKISNSMTNYFCTSKNGICYPSQQNIIYAQISYEDETLSLVQNKIENPKLKINYYEEENFVYATTNNATGIFLSPWNSNPLTTINTNTDVIIIGEGLVLGQEYTFEDYKYCLYTNSQNNYIGYIKTDFLTLKTNSESNLDEVFTVIANTPLYSLPTKILGTKIGTNLTTQIIMNIPEYSRIELIDNIFNYASNSTRFVKVCVNGNEVGYIDINQIQNKNDINIFITNNATIKLDDTKVYLDENDKNNIIITLNSGTRVQVNGTRNRKTGLTSITFSDEYGNTYSGFVSSDSVKTDGWTNLQMLGSIFIAINLGILFMIFYFRKKRLIIRESKSIIDK